MEESGVSKRVSVRFEDVSEDGRIRPEAIARPSMPAIEAARATVEKQASKRAA
jgi:hypothetical protein